MELQASPQLEYEPKATDVLGKWIERLVHQESSGRADIKILDVNDRYSYGCLQFQEATFVSYSKRYFGTSNLSKLYDCQYQKQLARRMLEEDINNWRHWYNSTRKIGLPPLR